MPSRHQLGWAESSWPATQRIGPAHWRLGLNTGVADVHSGVETRVGRRRRASEALLDTYDQERRPVGVAATGDTVANLKGMFEVVAALGLPRRAVRLLPRVVAAIPPLLPRRTVRAVIRGLTALAYQRLRLAKSAGWVGRRVRRRAAAAIAGRGPHYRSWDATSAAIPVRRRDGRWNVSSP